MEIDLSTLKVGDSVELRNGKCFYVMKITKQLHSYFSYLIFYCHGDFTYQSNGRSCNKNDYDIIDIIKKEKPMEKRKFKVGDKVICIKDLCDDIKWGDIATLESWNDLVIFPIHKNIGKNVLVGNDANHYHEHFELIEETKENNTIIQNEVRGFKITLPLDKNYDVDVNGSTITAKEIKDAEGFPLICPPLKPEDLKVGMIFSNAINYFKVITIYKKYVFVEILRIDDNEMYCLNEPIETFLRCTKLIDKVPSKIVEVEEEAPIYIENTDYKKLKENDYCCVSVNNFSTSSDKIELCKIKRTAKKELEFNWDKGIYE